MTRLLPLGEIGARALPGETYRLALTPGLIDGVFRRVLPGVDEPLIPSPRAVLARTGPGAAGFVESGDLRAAGLFPAADLDGHWWIPSGRIFHTADPAAPAATELASAIEHFFRPVRYVDAFGNPTTVAFDGYDLLPMAVTDAARQRHARDGDELPGDAGGGIGRRERQSHRGPV